MIAYRFDLPVASNDFLPTFLEDGPTLDEEGVRLDVQAAIAQGFFGTLPMNFWFPQGDPRRDQFDGAVLDEARGKLKVQMRQMAAIWTGTSSTSVARKSSVSTWDRGIRPSKAQRENFG